MLQPQHIKRIRELHRMLTHTKDNPLLDDNGEPIKFAMQDWHKSNGCGTACCAAGHMPYWPAFKNDGWEIVHGHPSFAGHDYVGSSSKSYFGTEAVHEKVFVDSYYAPNGGHIPIYQVTIDMVIARVEEILRENGATP